MPKEQHVYTSRGDPGFIENGDVLVDALISLTLAPETGSIKVVRPLGAGRAETQVFLANVEALVRKKGYVLEHRTEESIIWLWVREPDIEDVPEGMLIALGTLLRSRRPS